MTVIRPSDANEAAEAWRAAMLNTKGPTALMLTRQNLPVLDRTLCAPAAELHKGGYVLWQSSTRTPQLILIGTGSETHLALEAGQKLAAEGIAVRVVALPSWELFDRQPAEYRESVLPSSVRARLAVEAGIATGWEHYVGLDGAVVGMHTFGASAPGPVAMEKFGFTVGNIIVQARAVLKRQGSAT
jgi:transketolase